MWGHIGVNLELPGEWNEAVGESMGGVTPRSRPDDLLAKIRYR